MAFGTDALQYLVQIGEHVRVRGVDGEFFVHFAQRTAHGYVAYAIVERSLWLTDRP
jgi:hypothetical protein